MFVADGGKSVSALLAPTREPFRPEMRSYEDAQEQGVYNMWQIHLERSDLQMKYLDRWNAAGLDAILCPTAPYAACEHEKFRYVGYTCVYNCLDYSAVSFPTGLRVDRQVDSFSEEDQARETRNEFDKTTKDECKHPPSPPVKHASTDTVSQTTSKPSTASPSTCSSWRADLKKKRCWQWSSTWRTR